MEEERLIKLIEEKLSHKENPPLDLKTILGVLGVASGLIAVFWNVTTSEVSQVLEDRRQDSDQLIKLSTSVDNALQKLEDLETSIHQGLTTITSETEDLSDRLSEVEKKLYLLEQQQE